MLLDSVVSLAPMLGPSWLSPEVLIERFGPYALVGICLIVFIETGLLFPFLPGDSLLFTAGLLVAQSTIDVNIWVMCLALFVSAFVGDQVGYYIGRRFGVKLFENPDARILKPKYLDQAHDFFERYGGRALVIARFVPFLRTFAPVAAGIGKYKYSTFLTYNALGALLWGVGVTLLGYYLGSIPAVRDNAETAILIIVFVSVLPIAVEYVLAKRKAAKAQ